jgi:hypothetical protein
MLAKTVGNGGAIIVGGGDIGVGVMGVVARGGRDEAVILVLA